MDPVAALAGALVAGGLTVLAPCALSLLPVIVGGAVSGAADLRAVRRALVITASLGASVAAFTLLLKASTALIDIPVSVWRGISGGLLIALGLAVLPEVPEDLRRHRAGGPQRRGAGRGRRRGGADRGGTHRGCARPGLHLVQPVVRLCGGDRLARREPVRGLVLLAAYVLGLVVVLLTVALLGQRADARLRWAADPKAPWRRVAPAPIVVIGVLVLTGAMQVVETWILEHSPVAPWEVGSDIGR